MNFFEHQDKARRQSKRLVFLFILAVLAIVLAIDAALVIGFGLVTDDGTILFSSQALSNNASLLIGGSVGTVSVIGLASIFKTASLRSGGGVVARSLGGTLVDADTRDPMRRRLRNVVEEIAIASGVPVPEIYVLEQESGINAFAAGFSPSDAAIAVTRGTMEKLSRNELQGVIAHEFSHVFNGDMRLNIRLMGALFGILVLALIGRRVLHHAHYAGRSRSNNSSSGGIFVVALVLVIIGYIGLFFGRWIKAAVSRQREYLADASAVQFTRDPEGISGALKKIAVHAGGSFMNVESEEVGHMLFGSGQSMSMFATHPPLMDRIRKVDPSFDESELKTIAERLQQQAQKRAEREARIAEREAKRGDKGGAAMFDPATFMEQIGNPDWERLMVAATVAASIPEAVSNASHSADWAPEVLFFTLLDDNEDIRQQQMLIIARKMGSDSDQRLQGLLGASGLLGPEQRLPVMEMALPSLKRHPPEFIRKVLETVDELIEADGRVEVFEYLLARLVSQYLWEAMNPSSARMSGGKSLAKLSTEAAAVMSVLARHGHDDQTEAEKAFEKGIQSLGQKGPVQMPADENWTEVLDRALPKLDRLTAAGKETFVRALIETVTADQKLVPGELEILRAVCALIHVPMPMIPAQAS